VGILLGALVPQSWSLDFTLALTFIALLVPLLRDRPSLAAALSAGLTALLFYGLPYRLGLILAALVRERSCWLLAAHLRPALFFILPWGGAKCRRPCTVLRFKPPAFDCYF
jgi:predicted branched-subunit amino acid permease